MEKHAKNSNMFVQITLIPFPTSQLQRYGNILYVTLKEKHVKQLKDLWNQIYFKQHESLF